MKCKELAEILVDYVAGELSPELAEHIREHLCLCPPCVRFVETYQVTIRVTRKLPMVAMPPDLMRRLKQAIEDAVAEDKAERG